MTDYTPVVRDGGSGLPPPSQTSGPEAQPQDLPANQYRQHYQPPSQHHHHHPHHQKSYYHRIKDATYGTWLCIIVGALLIGLLIFFLIYTPVQASSNQEHISKLETKVYSKNQNRFSSNSMHSSGNKGGGGGGGTRGEGEHSFCHLGRYHISGPLLIRSDPNSLADTSTTIGEGGDDDGKKETETYYIDSFMRVSSNVESEEIDEKRERHGKKKYEKYFVVHYELKSNFPQFSTIRLVESTLDIYGTVVNTTRNIILCSNNPKYRIDNRRCSRLTSRDNLIKLNHTLDYPMLVASPSTIITQPPPTPFRQKSGSGKVVEEKEEEEEEEEEEKYYRFYKLRFYRESDDGDDDSNYREYAILSIEPTLCTN